MPLCHLFRFHPHQVRSKPVVCLQQTSSSHCAAADNNNSQSAACSVISGDADDRQDACGRCSQLTRCHHLASSCCRSCCGQGQCQSFCLFIVYCSHGKSFLSCSLIKPSLLTFTGIPGTCTASRRRGSCCRHGNELEANSERLPLTAKCTCTHRQPRTSSYHQRISRAPLTILPQPKHNRVTFFDPGNAFDISFPLFKGRHERKKFYNFRQLCLDLGSS